MMDKTEKEALIQAGYRFGNIREFLGLTPEECQIVDEMHRLHDAAKKEERSTDGKEEEAQQAQVNEQESQTRVE